ncbi:MAG: glycosyltransferase [Clostridia bacterium]|nr:glycosyltransferase [Clostridia bacterium]
MNVLMFTNYAPADIQKKQGSVMVNEGWVYGLQQNLLRIKGIKLHVMYPQNIDKEPIFESISDNFVANGYYHNSNNFSDEENIKLQIKNYRYISDIDVIHIMGTEFFHSLAAFHAMNELGLNGRTVISIQGLVSFCAKHYDYGVPKKYCYGFSIQEIYNGFSSINKRKEEFEARGVFETRLLSECKNVIGRTNWDKRCTRLINPDIQYYHNGENLRSSFYSEERWNIENCEKYSIFVSQATYPLKGLHHVLSILPDIVKKYPETKLYVGGKSPINTSHWKCNSYANYLNALIKRGNLEDHVCFCGSLSEEDIKKRYLKSHVFLSPSNIENSSNSIGEAMMLGVPVVASNVGGTDSVLENGKSGFLYPLTESYIMVQEIFDIFGSNDLANYVSKNAIEYSSHLYDSNENIRTLLEIYRRLSNS